MKGGCEPDGRGFGIGSIADVMERTMRARARTWPLCTLRRRPMGTLGRSCKAMQVQDEAVEAPVGGNGTGAAAPTFQEALLRLTKYWARNGCAVHLPYHTEVGAGTMNPATFLRVAGPEPWNAAYAEPSMRPDDARYGDNPNRVGRHTQFQVIAKPAGSKTQELYLGSLAALGVDVHSHDVRFVEDNWESPVLGAWGLGWEVWLDGMEITQFTYFQQAGGIRLSPPAVEITYGLERILMALQQVDHFKDIRYADGITYGEVFLQSEYEMSVYHLDVAEVKDQKARFDSYEEEAKRMLDRRLPVPAYDNLLKASHAFNVLDARGAVGVTERAAFFAKMRALARGCAQLWLDRREELGFPLGVWQMPSPPLGAKPVMDEGYLAPGSSPRDFLLEIGSEELPPQDAIAAAKQLSTAMTGLLDRLRLAHKGITAGGTPRRSFILVKNLVTRQEDLAQRIRGPPARVAYDEEGKATKALEGFCRKNGVSLDEVEIGKDNNDKSGADYIFADVRTAGRPTADVLSETLAEVVEGIAFPKTMRWLTDASYSRPVRWIVAMHGNVQVPFVAMDLLSGATTRLLRSAVEPEVELKAADEYLDTMEKAGIVVNMELRRQNIHMDAMEAASSVKGSISQRTVDALLEEVTNLVESPRVILGKFNPDFLRLPQEVLEIVMKKHQRYFAIEDTSTGKLLPYFITVANGTIDEDVVREGNEAVLRARYEDARFFYKSDCSKSLLSFREKLDGTVFQEKLGSMLDKSTRLEKLAGRVVECMELSPGVVNVVSEAAPLAHCDLATDLVTEFTSLAGTMGRHYAGLEGKPEEVCSAIYEFVLPRSAGDDLPSTDAGAVLAITDRLDSLVGLFAAGCAPSASADPFGLRRAAYGLVQTLVGKGMNASLASLIEVVGSEQPLAIDEGCRTELLTFVRRRLEQLLVDDGVPVEAVRAVLNERGDDPSLAASTAKELAAEMKTDTFAGILASLARPTRITRGKEREMASVVDPDLFEVEEERVLWEAYETVSASLEGEVGVSEFVRVCSPIVGAVDSFFEKVFVMADDERIRRNRLALLHKVANLPCGIVDLSQLPGF